MESLIKVFNNEKLEFIGSLRTRATTKDSKIRTGGLRLGAEKECEKINSRANPFIFSIVFDYLQINIYF